MQDSDLIQEVDPEHVVALKRFIHSVSLCDAFQAVDPEYRVGGGGPGARLNLFCDLVNFSVNSGRIHW